MLGDLNGEIQLAIEKFRNQFFFFDCKYIIEYFNLLLLYYS